MSNEHSTQSAETHKNIAEIINPKNSPEAAFQSYDKLGNNAPDKKGAFLDGEHRNPDLDYPDLRNSSDMDAGISRLADMIDQVKQIMDEGPARDATISSLEYRKAEMGFIILLGKLDSVMRETNDDEQIANLVHDAKYASEALYGRPDPKIRDAALNSVWNVIDGKEWSGKARQLYDDLNWGFTSAEGYSVSNMRRADDKEAKFPELGKAIEWAGEYFQAKNADIQAMFEQFWKNKVDEYGENYVCAPGDIVDSFQRAFAMRDPENNAGIRVLLVPGKTALSWDSAQMAVLVGHNRSPIKKPELLFTRFIHEGGHGERAINGLKTEVPVLATGMYTDTDKENPDYLTFEEGFLTTIESAIDGSQLPWKGGGMNYYLGISFAEEGDDFRSVFEKLWRINLLQGADVNREISDEDMNKYRSAAYTACVRIFRGTPTDLGNRLGAVLTYNKDLAYLKGRVIAMQYITEAYESEDEGMLEFAMQGKFDPTNPKHTDIAKGAIEKSRLRQSETG